MPVQGARDGAIRILKRDQAISARAGPLPPGPSPLVPRGEGEDGFTEGRAAFDPR
jgi:hypothetical protein